jgi:hypothetical protein
MSCRDTHDTVVQARCSNQALSIIAINCVIICMGSPAYYGSCAVVPFPDNCILTNSTLAAHYEAPCAGPHLHVLHQVACGDQDLITLEYPRAKGKLHAGKC